MNALAVRAVSSPTVWALGEELERRRLPRGGFGLIGTCCCLVVVAIVVIAVVLMRRRGSSPPPPPQ